MPDETPAADGEVVWSWRRDPGATSVGSNPAGYGGKRGRSPGRARNKPPNHCAGKAGMSWLYLSNPCALFYLPIAHGAAGAAGARPSLRPLHKREHEIAKLRRKSRRESDDACLFPLVSRARCSAQAVHRRTGTHTSSHLRRLGPGLAAHHGTGVSRCAASGARDREQHLDTSPRHFPHGGIDFRRVYSPPLLTLSSRLSRSPAKLRRTDGARQWPGR